MHHHTQNIKLKSTFMNNNRAFEGIEISYEHDRIGFTTCVETNSEWQNKAHGYNTPLCGNVSLIYNKAHL